MVPFFWNSGREEIFLRMYEMEKDFMIWMGDNVYYLFGQWKKNYQMHKSIYGLERSKITNFANTHHYATWDDHDYGLTTAIVSILVSSDPWRYSRLLA